MKTAETIEASEARKEQQDEATPEKKKRGPYKQRTAPNPNRFKENPNMAREGSSVRLKPFMWQPGQSGNPSGRPKNDVAHQIARAAFENNAEALYDAFSKALLKGNAYAFSQLADRAYGKIAERVEFAPGAEYRDMSSEALVERIKLIESKLGITISVDTSRGTGVDTIRTLPPNSSQED